MWHASVAHHGRRKPSVDEYVYQCRRALSGVGNAVRGEFWESGRGFVHVRRCLSYAEQDARGLVVRDVRGTPEHAERLAAVRLVLPPELRVASDEALT